jgi:RNA polymerase sigma factor (sigma-70 family)
VTTDVDALVEGTKRGDRRAAEALVGAIQDDVYRLALRMLGLRADAEDATQEILLQALTHLSEFRGESAFRTWVWRIATRHLLRARRGKREELASFEMLETLVARGEGNPEMPPVSDPELAVLVEEVRLACTEGMILALDRELRLSFILAEVFDLSSEEAADILSIEPAAHRKRLSRARDKLAGWMSKHCGLVPVDGSTRDPPRCRCARQVPVALEAGVADLHDLQFAGHVQVPAGRRALPVVAVEAREIEATVSALRCHPAYAAPGSILAGIRAIIDSGRYRVFDA